MALPVHLHLSRLAQAVLCGLAAWPLGAFAGDLLLPVAPTVVHGQARITTTGQTMTVTTGRNAAIDWRSFSIGPQAAVRFDQADAASQVLNRVLGRDPSQILGRLSSNGEVWLLNPYGVLFGRDARVDVAGLVASTLNLSTADWAAGRRRLDQLADVPSATVSNAGTLRSSSGGRILLVGGGGVVNDGEIDAPQGRIGLHAAASVELADSAQPDIAVRVFAPGQAVLNRGVLSAAGGVIDLQGAMVNQAGVVRADGLASGPGGAVLLRASNSLVVEAGSLTSATGAPGGRVDLLGGTQLVQGRIDAGSSTALGGRVHLAGPQIAVLDGAALQVDGALGGGAMSVGAAHEASGLRLPAAQAVYVGSGARLSADALQRGDGGSLRLWSDGATRAFGRFSARGGPNGGNGGLIETSGMGLEANPAGVDTHAPRGKPGLWLLDPLDVRIVQGNGNDLAGVGLDFSPLGTNATIGTNTILSALASGNVSISTGAVGGEPGTISMSNVALNVPLGRIVPSSGDTIVERTLTLNAASGISLQRASIVSSGGLLHVRLLAGSGAEEGITLNSASIDVLGDLTLRGGRFSTQASTAVARQIDLQASRVALGTPPASDGIATTLFATGAGNALVVRGLVDNVDTFTSSAGSRALATGESGRWLLYARNPANTQLDGLGYQFKQFGAIYPAAALGGGNGLLYATQPVLGVTATDLPLNKVYDGSPALALSAAQFDTVALSGFLLGDVPRARTGFVAGLRYDSRNAGAAVPITASLKGELPAVFDGVRPVYGYTFTGQGLVGRITPAPVQLAAANVADKVYDGGTAASVANWSLRGVLSGDSVSVVNGTSNFLSAQAGASKPVLAQASALGGTDAANYQLTAREVNAVASIAPATLSYRAQPVTVVAGRGWPALAGTVNGFVPGESLTTATSGTLRFSTPAGPASPAGAYAVQGTGLTAANYTLVDDPANAQALRVLPAGSEVDLPRPNLPSARPTLVDEPGHSRVTVLEPTSVAGFAPLDAARLPGWQLDGAFRSRELALARPFRAGKAMLDANPRLADLPDCADVAGAVQGDCIVTPVIKIAMQGLWAVQPQWSGVLAGLHQDVLFYRMYWRGDIDLSKFGVQALVLPGDNTLALTTSSGLPSTSTLTPQMLVLAAAAAGQVGAAAGVQGAAGAPPAVIVASAATPEQLIAMAPTAAAANAPGRAPVCETPKQQLSGECQRQTELDALRGALQRCAAEARDKQPACLFSEQVKFHLQQRQREERLLSITLHEQEARQATLPEIRRKWALVIGVEHYPKVVLSGQPVRMPSAGHDARAVAAELRGGFGYITSELVNPSRAQVVQRLNMLAAVAQPNDSLLIFFSGYGFSIAQGDDAVWALSDADPHDGRTVLSHADLAKLLGLIDARQVALISDSSLAGRLRVKPVDYNALAAPDALGLLDRRATVALTSGGNLPLSTLQGQGLSDFAAQLVGVLRRVKTWHVGGRIFREVQTPLIQAGRPFVPQYGAASESLHQQRADYIFERRELQAETPAKP